MRGGGGQSIEKMALTFSRRSTEQSLVFGTANESTMPDQRPTLVRRRSTSQSLQSHGRAGPQIRPATSTSMRLATRNANVALQCWTLPASEGGAGGTQANLLERAISSVSLTAGVAEEGEDGDFLRRGNALFRPVEFWQSLNQLVEEKTQSDCNTERRTHDYNVLHCTLTCNTIQ